MSKPGAIRRYFRKYGLPGLALHLYVGWQASVFVMPRENIHWWPPHEAPVKLAYEVSDVLTPKFLEPPQGRFKDTAYKSYLDVKIPSIQNNFSYKSDTPIQTLQNWNDARKKYIDDKVRNYSGNTYYQTQVKRNDTLLEGINRYYQEWKVPYIDSDEQNKYFANSSLDSTREQLIKNKVDAYPQWIGNRGNPGSLGYMVVAYALAEYWKRRHCKKRGDGK